MKPAMRDLVLACGVLCALIGCSRRVGAPAYAQQFDELINRELIQQAVGNRVEFSFTKTHSPTQLEYQIGFPLGTTNAGMYSYGWVCVAPAGHLLDVSKYEKRRSQIAEMDTHRPPDERLGPMMFPPLGKRAAVGIVYGPNGGGETIVFTTSDGNFDVEVSQRNHSKKEQKVPTLDTGKLAEELCKRYDARMRNQLSDELNGAPLRR